MTIEIAEPTMTSAAATLGQRSSPRQVITTITAAITSPTPK